MQGLELCLYKDTLRIHRPRFPIIPGTYRLTLRVHDVDSRLLL